VAGSNPIIYKNIIDLFTLNSLLLLALLSYLLLMIRILTIALAFLAITVLLASSFATLFPDSDGTDNSTDDSVLEDAAPVQNVSNDFKGIDIAQA